MLESNSILSAWTVPAPVSILIVDDEARNLDALEAILQAPDITLVRATTADEALRHLMVGDFAALLLDIRMPTMSGIELADLIKQRPRSKDVPIIFLTAHFQDDKDVLQGYGTGAVDFLTKPINPQILKSKIGIFVDLFRKSNALREINKALGREVVQREKAEEALRKTNAELEERVRSRTADLAEARDAAVAASRAKDEFLARLSHELRTPLNPVLLVASDAAEKTDLPPDIRADFQMIASNVALEARLIDDLLDLSMITQGKLALKKRAFDFNAVLRDAASMVRPEITEKNLSLHLDLGPDEASVIGDDVRLKQIFWNILKNAVKFTPEGGQLSIHSRRLEQAQTFEVRITDTGMGMSAEEVGRAFEAFAQGDHARANGQHTYGGLGLGLAISRVLTELHGGRISAASEGLGRGTTFTVHLPLPRAEKESQAGRPVQPSRETSAATSAST